MNLKTKYHDIATRGGGGALLALKPFSSAFLAILSFEKA